ncbi:hypothetical protein INS49_003657 [Diaporthe citri]|uniref:uncharacterized protein n=1 Tax=Diaporthe citri TaxID=83186 RepID=UPI001C7F5536|nr:uncharacterized protein INS49_003657 [Diaporthe citri]KAG6355693.1 hypothetical protein INS49_003657 [Diaporthe citri]
MVARRLKSPLVGATASFAASQKVTEIVKSAIDDIRANGDKAVRTCSEKFDKWAPESFKLSDSQIQDIISKVPEQTIKDIKEAQKNVRTFAQAQRDSIKDVEIERAYIPGGRYPLLASAHMAITTAKVAGVKHFLAGPGNAFVAEAKRQLFGEIGIDLLAGPTETLVVADGHADPFTVATDLLSQAEHGPDTPAVLITTSEEVARESIRLVDEQLKTLSTAELAATSEHVEILTQKPREALEEMTNYGALFLGEKTCVSYGDKCIGTNHVLPTRKAGRYTGGLWVGKYLKTQTYQEVVSEKASGELGRLCGRCARAENFEGHARSGDLRSQLYLKDQHDWIDQARASKQTNGH